LNISEKSHDVNLGLDPAEKSNYAKHPYVMNE
ncbi:hypothetical protein PL2TA16_04508, partial [Pseudoalteromonas luteoviolacea 2ta16]